MCGHLWSHRLSHFFWRGGGAALTELVLIGKVGGTGLLKDGACKEDVFRFIGWW